MKSSYWGIFLVGFALTNLFSCGNDDSMTLSNAKSIISFSVDGVEGVIDQSTKTISLGLFETDLTAITPSISISGNATISPASGVAQDFTNPVTYTVTAQDGSSETFTVTVFSVLFTFSSDGTNYELVRSNMSWTDAAAFAVARGGILAEINSEEEQTAIFEALNNASIIATNTVAADGGGASYVWIGGNDLATEGEWIWDGDNDQMGAQFWMGVQDGSPIGGLYNNWGDEPDDFGSGQDGLGLAITDWPLGVAGQWNDVDHTNELYFLVELN